jgi:hypothetical protein
VTLKAELLADIEALSFTSEGIDEIRRDIPIDEQMRAAEMLLKQNIV